MEYQDFLTHVLPSTPGCPNLVAIDHIRKAARMFCMRTNCWNFEDEITTGKGIKVYPLAVDDEIERVRLQALRVDGSVYTTVDPLRGRSWARNQCGGSRFAFLDNPTDLVISPVPNDDGRPIVMQISVKPSLTSTEWPDDLVEFVDDIAHGAIATLCMLPKEEWSDTQLAGYHGSIFNQRCAVVAKRVSSGFQSNTRRAQRFY